MTNLLSTNEYKHPPALWYLAIGQGVISIGSGFIWSLFVLYLTKYIHLDQTYTYNIFASGTAMLGVVGLLCGYIAQKTGYLNTLFAGMILRIIAFALLSVPNIYFIEWSLAFFAVGQGFSFTAYLLVLGRVYAKDDPRRDSAFTFSTFVMNIGFLASGVGGFLLNYINYSITFLVGGGCLLVGTLIYAVGIKYIKAHPTQTLEPEISKNKTLQYGIIIVSTLIMLPLVFFCLHNLLIANSLIIGCSIGITVFWIIIASKSKGFERNPLFILLILCGAQIIWNGLHYCESSSLIMYIKENVNKVLFGLSVPASTWSIDINTIYTLLFTALFAVVWLKLAKKGKNPSIPSKLTFGMFAVGIGWGILFLITKFNPHEVNSILWVILAYLPIIISGAILYPIGNSMIGKFTPQRWEGLMMATFQLYTMGTGVLLGAQFADLSVVPKLKSIYFSNIAFSKAFGLMAFLGLITAILMLILLPWMKRMVKYKIVITEK